MTPTEKKVLETLQGLRNWEIILHTPNDNGKVIHTRLTIKEANDLFIMLNGSRRNMDTWYQMKTFFI